MTRLTDDSGDTILHIVVEIHHTTYCGVVNDSGTASRGGHGCYIHRNTVKTTTSTVADFRGGCMTGFWLASGAMVVDFNAREILPRFTQKAWNMRSYLVLSGWVDHGMGLSHG